MNKEEAQKIIEILNKKGIINIDNGVSIVTKERIEQAPYWILGGSVNTISPFYLPDQLAKALGNEGVDFKDVLDVIDR